MMNDPSGPELQPEDPPSMWSFMERSVGRLLTEAVLGATAGGVIAVALEVPELRTAFLATGAVAAPLALMLTPVHGAVWYRAFRYGVAVAVILTLIVSFTGMGLERPAGELVVYGALFLVLGTLAHTLMALTLDRDGTPPTDADGGPE